MSASPTLFFDLTHQSPPSFAATAAIKYLIEVIGSYVCAFKRNNQVSYRFVERARDLCDAINILIDRVDKGGDWNDYDNYVAAINPLEQYVVGFLDLVLFNN